MDRNLAAKKTSGPKLIKAAEGWDGVERIESSAPRSTGSVGLRGFRLRHDDLRRYWLFLMNETRRHWVNSWPDLVATSDKTA